MKHLSAVTNLFRNSKVVLQGLNKNVQALIKEIKNFLRDWIEANKPKNEVTWKWSTGSNTFDQLPLRVAKALELGYKKRVRVKLRNQIVYTISFLCCNALKNTSYIHKATKNKLTIITDTFLTLYFTDFFKHVVEKKIKVQHIWNETFCKVSV